MKKEKMLEYRKNKHIRLFSNPKLMVLCTRKGDGERWEPAETPKKHPGNSDVPPGKIFWVNYCM